MDNRAIAQVLGEIADLLEIKGDNAFKIRAYRSASETIAVYPDAVSRLDDRQLRDIPGIGRDLAARIRELADSGTSTYHRELLDQFPHTILELLRLQGVGPKTVALLFSALHISSLEALAAAAREGHLRSLKGMGPKKEALILKAIAEREKDAGRHLLADTAAVSAELIDYLSGRAAAVEFIPVGSVRRGCDTCGDIDILAVGGEPSLMDLFLTHPRVERVLGHGDSKSSVWLQGGFQADLRLVPVDSRGAAMQYFTGSKAHNIVLRDRAIQRGMKLNEYGLFRLVDDSRIAGDSEAAIYEALDLRWIEPELRENRGEIDAASQNTLPDLISLADLRGDLHMHTTATDGRDDLESMAAAAQRLGYEYIAITDHSKAMVMSNGLDERRVLDQAAHIRALNGRYEGLTLLAGVECDILGDGTLDLADDCLAQLDWVVASVHSHFGQEEAQMTDRLLRAIECPWVDVLGHPTGRLLFKREPARVNMDALTAASARLGVALEINAQTARMDLCDSHARLARERGVRLVVSTDAHSVQALNNLQWGVRTARRAWAARSDVLNARSLTDLKSALRRSRQPSAAGASRG